MTIKSWYMMIVYVGNIYMHGQRFPAKHMKMLLILPLCTIGPLSHAWPFCSSSSCSMRLLSPPLLAVNCLSCSPLGGPGPPSFLPPGLTPFPSGSRHHPTSSLDTSIVKRWSEWWTDNILYYQFLRDSKKRPHIKWPVSTFSRTIVLKIGPALRVFLWLRTISCLI